MISLQLFVSAGFGILFPESHTQRQSLTVIEKIKVRGGGKKESNLSTSSTSIPSILTTSKPTNSLGPKETIKSSPKKSEPTLSIRLGAGSNGGNGRNGNFDNEIEIKNWEKWTCPNPDEVISHPAFWDSFDDNLDICTDEDTCENLEIEEEIEIEKFPRRKLLAVPGSIPTGKLDAENLEKFDFTQKKLQPMKFPSRDGIKLSMDHRSLRKIVYGHPEQLGLSDLDSRIPCPVQTDPDKF